MGKKLSIADLMAQKEKPLRESLWVDVPGLGGEIEVRRRPLARFLELTSSFTQDDPAGMLRAQYELIYEFCPILHDPELQAEFGCKIPTEIVPLVFQENMGDMNRVIEAVSGFYLEAEEQVKN